MSFSFAYNMHEPVGRQFEMVGAERDVIAALMARGQSESDSLRLVAESRGHIGRRIVAPRRPASDTDMDAMASFIEARYEAKLDAMVPFAHFYQAFIALNPKWSRKRVSQSLPIAHPSIAGTGNRRFVLNLTPRQTFAPSGRRIS